MNKVPYVERPFGYTTGVTGECAYVWALFLMQEADMADDYIKYDKFKAMAEQLSPKERKPVPAIVHYAALEDEIKKYSNKREYISVVNCAQE